MHIQTYVYTYIVLSNKRRTRPNFFFAYAIDVVHERENCVVKITEIYVTPTVICLRVSAI